MSENTGNYRGHLITTHASGETDGPWEASYFVNKVVGTEIESTDVKGVLSQEYVTTREAHTAAISIAKQELDLILDKE